MTDLLKPEDYMEPACLLCDEPYGAEPAVRSVPQRRIIEKMDEYMARRDYEGAGRHLLYWLEEARLGQDLRGELMIRNELIGHYRKTAQPEGAFENIRETLSLLEKLGFEGTISAGTTYVNAATAYHAFGEWNKAMELFERAKAVYESSPAAGPQLLGGLYNNMALTCQALKRYDDAQAFYRKAYERMGQVSGGCLEQAITCLNMAGALEEELGMEQAEPRIYELLDQACELLDDPDAPRDGYYAFVCEKCAPGFSYYGYFAAAEEYNRRAEEIYAGNGTV